MGDFRILINKINSNIIELDKRVNNVEKYSTANLIETNRGINILSDRISKVDKRISNF
jgi:hypothetical protein